MKLTPCPQCRSRIIWKGCSPQSPQLSCIKCGHNWNDTLLESQCQFGFVLGDWDDVELYKLELQLRCDKPAKDWYFLKGRKIWTAWRNWWEADDVIVVTMLDDLIEKVAATCQKENTKK